MQLRLEKEIIIITMRPSCQQRNLWYVLKEYETNMGVPAVVIKQYYSNITAD